MPLIYCVYVSNVRRWIKLGLKGVKQAAFWPLRPAHLMSDSCCFTLIHSPMWSLFHTLRCAASCSQCRTRAPCCEGHAEVREGTTASPTTMAAAMSPAAAPEITLQLHAAASLLSGCERLLAPASSSFILPHEKKAL